MNVEEAAIVLQVGVHLPNSSSVQLAFKAYCPSWATAALPLY